MMIYFLKSYSWDKIISCKNLFMFYKKRLNVDIKK